MEKEKIASLVRQAQSGDAQAMERLLQLAHTSVSYQCRKIMAHTQDAEDMTQETLLKICTSLDTLREPERFLSWANTIAARLCINERKRNPKDLQFAEDEEGNSVLDQMEDLDQQKIPDAALDNEETSRMVTELIDGLPDAQRVCTYLFYYDQLSVKEIAGMVGVSENTIKSRLNYARKAIKEGVLDYERKGVKLYGVSPLPFLLYFLRGAAENSADASAAEAMAKSVLAAGSAAEGVAAASGVAGKAAAGVVAEEAAAGAAATAKATAITGITKAVATKLAAAALAGTLAVSGVALTLDGQKNAPDVPEEPSSSSVELTGSADGSEEPMIETSEPVEETVEPTEEVTEPEEETTEPTEEVAEPVEETPEPIEEEQEPVEEITEPVENTAIPAFSPRRSSIDTSNPNVELYLETPRFEETSDAYRAINAYFDQMHGEFVSEDNSMVKAVLDNQEGATAEEPYYYITNYRLLGQDQWAVSVELNQQYYSGSGQWLGYIYYHTFDARTGEPLTLASLTGSSEEEITAQALAWAEASPEFSSVVAYFPPEYGDEFYYADGQAWLAWDVGGPRSFIVPIPIPIKES